jgi:phage virion morphogenesis protein
MASIIEVNVREIEQLAAKLNAYALTEAQSKSLLHSLGVEIAEQTKDRFDDERDPDGAKWSELTEAYAKRKTKKSRGGILVREGYMSKITFQTKGSAAVLVGSTMEYADYHQNAKKKNRRRKFLGLNGGNIADLSAAIDTFMKGKASD